MLTPQNVEMQQTEYMDIENRRAYIDQLFSSDLNKCLDAIVMLKNSIIGSNKEKTFVIETGIVPRLLQILVSKSASNDLLVETAVTLGSLSKGTEENVQKIVEAGAISVLLGGLFHPHPPFVESNLRCLRTILSSPCAPSDILFKENNLIPHMINIMGHSINNQECVVTIFTHCCKSLEQQNLMAENGVLSGLTAMLCSPAYKVQLSSLHCLCCLCHKNEKVSVALAETFYNNRPATEIIKELLSRDKPSEMQFAAAKCLTYLCRSTALRPDDPKILYKTLSCLVRMCKGDHKPEDRIAGAETLACLTEIDTDLQRIASVSDHLISTLAEYLKYQPKQPSSSNNAVNSTTTNSSNSSICTSQIKKYVYEIQLAQELKQAAFNAFGSLGANDEEIRKKIIETDSLMEHIVSGLCDGNPKIQLAAVRCLHSLSRSVQQLRTTFQDHTVWKPLMKLLNMASEDVLMVASSTLCNLLLEFSPSKEPIMEAGAVGLLCELTRKEDPALKLNGIWALMNMAFQAEQKIKSQILATLGMDQVFRLLADPDVHILMKTLGLLRNLLSTKPHIDHIMTVHGKQIMQAVILILEGDHTPEVKEQALCILSNIADGDTAKTFIMSNEDVLKKLKNYLTHSNTKLRIAATYCVCNLVWNEEEGASERQNVLRDMGFQDILQSMIPASDQILFDKVKTALQQFV